MIHEESADDPQMIQRLRVPEAASALGISEQAVRHRIRRATLDSEKDKDGTVWVRFEADTDTVSADSSEDAPPDNPQDTSGERALLDLVDVLREQLAAAEVRERRSDERERELRRIIAGLVQRVPELEGTRETPPAGRDTPERATEGAAGNGNAPEPQEPLQRRSWLSRFFFEP